MEGIRGFTISISRPALYSPLLPAPTPITDPAVSRDGLAWAGDGKSLYVLGRSEGRTALYSFNIASGASRHIVALRDYRGASALAGARLSLAPDGKSLAISVLEQDGDIWILDGFQPPRSFWERLWPW